MRSLRKPPALRVIETSETDPTGGGGSGGGPDTLPTIMADGGDLRMGGEASLDALRQANRVSPFLFTRGQGLWRVECDGSGRPFFTRLSHDHVRRDLARVAIWQKTNKDGRRSPGRVPKDFAAYVLAEPSLAQHFPTIDGIVSAPIFALDGSLNTDPGYAPASRLFYVPAPDFRLPKINENPSDAEITRAHSLICDELLGDFPFIGEAEKAHAVALLILLFMRPIIVGPTPLHLIEKPAHGTGAGLLVDVLCIVALGAPATPTTEGKDEDEWRKRITAQLASGASMILIDNLRRRLDSAAVSSAITASRWSDRLLGQSDVLILDVRCVWVATANNARLSGEISRRVVRIRLDARVPDPWTRRGFRHEDLRKWATDHRAELVWAVLTMIRSWVAAGRPPPEHPPAFGNFEAWARNVGGVLEHVGIRGFLDNLDDFHTASADEEAELKSLLRVWWERKASAVVGVSHLYEIAICLDPPFPLGDGGERSQRTRLGIRLKDIRDREFLIEFTGGQRLQLRVERAGEAGSGGQLWKLVMANQ